MQPLRQADFGRRAQTVVATTVLEVVVVVDAGLRARVLELVAAGESCTEAARQVGANARSVVRWANLAGMEL
ncbi:helix-turn-helix domain-containing protein, partial [Microlunatus sp. GCM10028923]|uniref:helix-turn-helix domain-containing protein n=1 Tax=Microlunatus sp. GCM10028923 TaxID=3273400 RepID=UPI003619C728